MSIKSNWGRILLGGASLAALGVAPAFAQNAQVSDEIVVTATGRTAAIQDVPIAVQAVTGQALENSGISDLRDLQQLTPSYRFYTGQSNTAGTNAIIRGIGTGGDNPGFEAAVGVFIDGVYRSRAGTALGDLPEVERVEVLRGPQGTLYGRNTSAGAISVVTAGPDFDGFHAWGEVEAGNLGALGTKVGINAPVSDTLALRLDGSIRSRDGYIHDVVSDRDINTRDRWSLRGQAVWDITPDASLRVIVDGGQTDEQCCSAIMRQLGSSATAINGYQALFGGGATGVVIDDLEDRTTAVSANRDLAEAVDEWGISGQLDWDLGFAQLTSVTGYRDWNSTRDQDIDFTGLDRAYRDGLEIGFETLTQEFRLHGEAGRLDWLVGAFVGHEKLTQDDHIKVGVDGAHYVDALAYFQDLTSLGAPDANGALPGSGYEIYRSINPASPLFLQVAFGALASTQNLAAPGGATIAGNLNAGIAGMAVALSTADPVAGDGQQSDYWEQTTDSIGIFTHNEISITDDLILTLGLRFNHEEKGYEADLNATYAGCTALQSNAAQGAAVLQYTPNPLLPANTQAALLGLQAGVVQFMALACNPVLNTAANGAHSSDRTEDEITGTASLAYHITDDFMVYGGYSRGFNLDRSGYSSLIPFSPAPPASDDENSFDPEFVNAYELGFKSTIFGGTTLNATAFYQQVEDFQFNTFSGFNFLTFNAPELISKGVEVEFNTRLTDNLSVQAGVTYNDAYYSKEVAVVSLVAADTIEEGQRLASAPEWTVTGGVTYSQPISDSLEMRFYLDGRYSSEYAVRDFGNNPLTDNDAYAIFNGRVALASLDDSWSVELWGRNLTDEYYNIGAFGVPEQNNLAVYPNEPRTYGITLKARY